MHKFNCSCGYGIEIIPPTEHAGYVVFDSDVDMSIDARTTTIREFLAAVKSDCRVTWLRDFYGSKAPLSRFDEKDDADVIEDILSDGDSWTRHLYRCPMCGRIHIETSPGSKSFHSYREE